VRAAGASGTAMYANQNERLGIDFNVERIAFPGIQTMDARLVRIPQGKSNERHRHAHESIFVILEGRGEVLIGEKRVPVAQGDVAFVPRWLFHQTTNTGDRELLICALTDFGFTSAVLGDYDKRTRLKEGGDDAVQEGAKRT
jgi:oxalate decarboxylase/phosphoglucose isomerase-like protein (cupin superfamily)